MKNLSGCETLHVCETCGVLHKIEGQCHVCADVDRRLDFLDVIPGTRLKFTVDMKWDARILIMKAIRSKHRHSDYIRDCMVAGLYVYFTSLSIPVTRINIAAYLKFSYPRSKKAINSLISEIRNGSKARSVSDLFKSGPIPDEVYVGEMCLDLKFGKKIAAKICDVVESAWNRGNVSPASLARAALYLALVSEKYTDAKNIVRNLFGVPTQMSSIIRRIGDYIVNDDGIPLDIREYVSNWLTDLKKN